MDNSKKYNNQLISQKSSKIVYDFLKENNLHKKEFAQMIGVTLSYVYNLIDENVAFSSRTTTLERIAIVMGINPENFMEYQIPSDIPPFFEDSRFIKSRLNNLNISNLDFLRQIEKRKRLDIIDTMRGVKSITIDYSDLKNLCEILKVPLEEFKKLWKTKLTNYLAKGGFNIQNNKEILECMLNCV